MIKSKFSAMQESQGHQARVKSSLEKLNVPAWYRDRQERAERRLRHESGESVLSSRSLGWRCGSGRGRGLGGQDPRLQPRLRHQRLVPTLPPCPGRCVQTGLGLRGYLYFIGSQEHQHLPPFILKQLFVLSIKTSM